MNLDNLLKNNIAVFISFTILIGSFICLGYTIERSQYVLLWTLIALSFFSYYVLYLNFEFFKSKKQLFLTALALRSIFLFSTPNLSDDYHRFVWDGNLIAQGLNPFELTPEEFNLELPENIPNQEELLSKMNSPKYFSVYPPLLQSLFTTASLISNGDTKIAVIVLKLFILLFEGISLLLLFKVLNHLKLPPKNWLLYAFNPLVIVEFTGNIHFEAIMVTGILASLYLLFLDKWKLSAVAFSIAIVSKLIPLILLPIIWRKLGLKKGFYFCVIACAFSLLFFLPFISEQVVYNFSNSLQLYFQTFEFNASVYFLAREIGFLITGYNMISIIGVILALTTLISILLISIKKPTTSNNMMIQIMFIFLTHIIMSSIVHPWYIAGVLLFSILSNYRFGIVWSGLIFLSYYAYKDTTYTESMLLILVQYSIMIAYLIYEIMNSKKDVNHSNSNRTLGNPN